MLRRVPALVALLVLGAHAVRAGVPLPLALGATLASIALLFVDRPLAGTLVAAVLWGGVATWARVAFVRASERLAEGRPWIRMVVILGAVALFTAWAATLVRRPRRAPSEAPTTGA
jgi:hypothetical protein